MKIFFSVMIALLGLFVSEISSWAADCLSYEPRVVQLSGKITRETFPGPPNYEEIKKGDKPETYWILNLAQPICVTGTSNDPWNVTVSQATRLQLIFLHNEYKRDRNLVNQKVMAIGTLMHAQTGHHHTDVLLTVQSLKLALP